MKLGDVVAVPFGDRGSLTTAARVVGEVEDHPGWWLVHTNVLGTHTAQMFPEAEMTPIDKPSDAARVGLCPACLGLGIVHRCAPIDGPAACSSCSGSGNLDLRVMVHADSSGVRAKVIQRS